MNNERRYHAGGVVGLRPGEIAVPLSEPREITIVNTINPEEIRGIDSNVGRAIRKRLAEELTATRNKWDQVAAVRRGDILFLQTDGRVVVCRVQRKRGEYDQDTYVCTNGARTFFVLESEIGSHQHYRDGVRVIDLCRAEVGMKGQHFYY